MEEKHENFKVIFKELELEKSRELLQFTQEVKIVVSQVESQEEDLEKVSALSAEGNAQMYFSTGT